MEKCRGTNSVLESLTWHGAGWWEVTRQQSQHNHRHRIPGTECSALISIPSLRRVMGFLLAVWRSSSLSDLGPNIYRISASTTGRVFLVRSGCCHSAPSFFGTIKGGQAVNHIIIINNCCVLTESYRVGAEQVSREAGLLEQNHLHNPSQCLLGQASVTSLTGCKCPQYF